MGDDFGFAHRAGGGDDIMDKTHGLYVYDRCAKMEATMEIFHAKRKEMKGRKRTSSISI